MSKFTQISGRMKSESNKREVKRGREREEKYEGETGEGEK